jgi:hypothetical protein
MSETTETQKEIDMLLSTIEIMIDEQMARSDKVPLLRETIKADTVLIITYVLSCMVCACRIFTSAGQMGYYGHFKERDNFRWEVVYLIMIAAAVGHMWSNQRQNATNMTIIPT